MESQKVQIIETYVKHSFNSSISDLFIVSCVAVNIQEKFLDFSTFKAFVIHQVCNSGNISLIFQNKDKLYQTFNVGNFLLKYLDEDNDQIPVECEDEFKETIKVAQDLLLKGLPLKLIVDISTKTDISENDLEKIKFTSETLPRDLKAREITNDIFKDSFKRNKHSTEIMSPISSTNNGPPSWFVLYMDKFKCDILNEVDAMILAKHQIYHNKIKSKPYRGKRISEEETSDNHLCVSEPRSTKILRKLEKLQKREKKLERKLDQRLEKMESKKKRMLEKVTQTKNVKRKLCEGSVSASYLIGGSLVNPLTPIHINPGERFSRTWELINDGLIPWTKATEMREAWGSAGLTPVARVVKCPLLLPGEQGHVTMMFNAPVTPGTYHSYWHLFHMGDRFGHWIVCTVIVEINDQDKISINVGQGKDLSGKLANKMLCKDAEYDSGSDLEGCFVKELSNNLSNLTLDKKTEYDSGSDLDLCSEELPCNLVSSTSDKNPEYDSGSDLEICSNSADSDSADSFVVVNLPMTLFSDLAAENKGTIPVKVLSKNCKTLSKIEKTKNVQKEISKTESKIEMDSNTSNSNEHKFTDYKHKDSVYVVDRAGTCLLARTNEECCAILNTGQISENINCKFPIFSSSTHLVDKLESSGSAASSDLKCNFNNINSETGFPASNSPTIISSNKAEVPKKLIDSPQKISEHILPEKLVKGAMNMASKAYSTAHSVFNNIATKQGLASDFDAHFESNVFTLVEMGFTNTLRNAEVLKCVGNDINRAVPILLSKDNNIQ
uniref:UBA domain-containing protein n=2 Tax=Clastoptera arizonana TaxID=38151 RepID=A0A1B6CDG6_9HEMI